MRTVLVTGCSSGFGEAIALAFAGNGDRVHATVRSSDAAQRLQASAQSAGATLLPLLLDVTDRSAIRAAVADIESRFGQVDILVNNAGIAIPGAIEDLDDADIELTLTTNFLAPLWLSRAVLPGMRRKGSGKIIMLSSLSALVGLPAGGIYSASKAALEAASEALRYEVDRFGIAVSVVEPGLFRTGMPGKIAAAHREAAGSAYAPLSRFLKEQESARLGEGDDPALLGKLILEIAAQTHPAFRYPAGDQAIRVVAALRELEESARGDFIRDVQKTRWWSGGSQKPGS